MSTKEIITEKIDLDKSIKDVDEIYKEELTLYIVTDLNYLYKDNKIFKKILKGLRLKNVEEFIYLLLFGLNNISVDELKEKIGQIDTPTTSDEIVYLAQVSYAKQYTKIDMEKMEKIFAPLNNLQENERQIFNSISNLIIKSYIKYHLFKLPYDETKIAFLKPFIIAYLESHKEFYNENEPDEVYDYIKKIKTGLFEDVIKKNEEKVKLYNEQYRYAKSISGKLLKLHDKLVQCGRIKSNTDFFQYSSSFSETKLNKTIWLKGQPELIYMCYLIYGGLTVEQTESIYSVITKLFVGKDEEYDEKILATSFSNIKDKIDENTLSKNLLSIKDILEDLQII